VRELARDGDGASSRAARVRELARDGDGASSRAARVRELARDGEGEHPRAELPPAGARRESLRARAELV
ncbi:MAG: hypothetical protein KC776_12995, partial [Myxococcales bacterium]|nr:hypothetical protein [Myxococcales bacterium]